MKCLVLSPMFLLVVACSPLPLPPGEADAADDGGMDAGSAMDASVECAEGSHASDGGACESTLTWVVSPQVIAPVRDHHTTTVLEARGRPFVYVIGGTDGWATVHSDVLRAPIQSDGSLGPFEKIGDLPQSRAGHTTVVVGRQILVSGGITHVPGGLVLLDTTVVSTLQDDGSLGPWGPGPTLPEPVMHHTCHSSGMTVFCVGGRIRGNFTGALAVRTELKGDGTFAPWTPVTPLASTRGFHQSFIYRGALFVAGGLHRDAPMPTFDMLKDVISAEIAADGSLGPWKSAGELPQHLSISAAEIFNDRVYFVGGMDADRALDTVTAASFASDAGLTDFQQLDSRLSRPRMHVHQCPVYRKWIYSIGGRDSNDSSLGTVDVGTFQ